MTFLTHFLIYTQKKIIDHLPLLAFLSNNISSVQFSSVTQSCLTLCDPMDCSTPGLPVHHQLLEFTKLMSIESVMPSNHLILCRPLLLPPELLLSGPIIC